MSKTDGLSGAGVAIVQPYEAGHMSSFSASPNRSGAPENQPRRAYLPGWRQPCPIRPIPPRHFHLRGRRPSPWSFMVKAARWVTAANQRKTDCQESEFSFSHEIA